MFYCDEIDDALHDVLGRRGLGLKVFKRVDELAPNLREHEHYQGMDESSPETFMRGYSSLLDATRIQNLFAWYGLAPRVYALVYFPKDGRWGQVVTFVHGKEGGFSSWKRVGEICVEHGIIARHGQNFNRANANTWATGSQITDFGLANFDGDKYINGLINRINNNRPASYQAIPELGIVGHRSASKRAVSLHLDEIDFNGKTVLDLGCNWGMFCHEALRRGAKRVVGVDGCLGRAKLAYEIANWLGFWNADFLDLELPRERRWISRESRIYEPFDIVLCLSTVGHIGGYGSWLGFICGEVLVLEGHNTEQPEKYQGALEQDFSRVEFRGFTEDWRVRPLFICWK